MLHFEAKSVKLSVIHIDHDHAINFILLLRYDIP